MNVQVDHHDKVLVAKVEGRVDSSNSQDFERQLQGAIGEDVQAVVVDLGQLAYISSAGLRVVLLVAKTLGQRNVSISLCALSDPVQSVFEISGFNRIIQIYDTQADALAAAG
ncbi:MAG: STAS domain-containing protein [Holophagales bacterium]|nr:STAS domain-containing protein [Acidobacteriota bacterium]MXW02563.1 STAS domain-containing protein [Holophagales bacterium]MXX61000.1 STAS domain-containing protein [Holophagales bacterium]MYC11771.1 STAS domain-containing protein [Holophagales bacterium]MYD22302.1 STAS domain-containing protein [Holophagales bacterium]